jgi:hypothetical protein
VLKFKYRVCPVMFENPEKVFGIAEKIPVVPGLSTRNQ